MKMIKKKKEIMLSILIFIVLFLLTYYGARKITYDVLLRRGNQFEKEGNIIESVKNLEKAAKYVFWQSSIHAKAGDVGIREHDAILVDKKESKLGKEGSLEVSVRNFMKSLEHNPQNPWAWSGLSEYFERKSYIVARPDVINVSKLPYGNLGNLDYEDWMAITTVKKAIELEPNNFFYHGLLGFILMENNISEPALKYYERAIELFPIPDEHFFIPEKSIPPEIYDSVEKGLENALTSNELITKERVNNELAQWSFYQGKLDLARDYFQKAMENGYDEYVILGKLGIISYLQGDYDKSLSFLSRSIKGDHNKAYEIYLIGEIYCKKGDHEDALNYFKLAKNSALEIASKQNYLFMIAREYEHMEEYSTAESFYDEAIQLNLDNIGAYKKVIEFYTRTGNIEKAKKYRELLSIKANNKM